MKFLLRVGLGLSVIYVAGLVWLVCFYVPDASQGVLTIGGRGFIACGGLMALAGVWITCLKWYFEAKFAVNTYKAVDRLANPK